MAAVSAERMGPCANTAGSTARQGCPPQAHGAGPLPPAAAGGGQGCRRYASPDARSPEAHRDQYPDTVAAEQWASVARRLLLWASGREGTTGRAHAGSAAAGDQSPQIAKLPPGSALQSAFLSSGAVVLRSGKPTFPGRHPASAGASAVSTAAGASVCGGCSAGPAKLTSGAAMLKASRAAAEPCPSGALPPQCLDEATARRLYERFGLNACVSFGEFLRLHAPHLPSERLAEGWVPASSGGA